MSKFQLTALILARGGSVSIPRKNICKLDGQPLLYRCIQELQSAGCFTSIWVSTDDEAIEKVALSAGAQVHWRAEFTATNEASSVCAVQEFLQHQTQCCEGILCLVQCTSPFLKSSYLLQAIQQIRDGVADSVFSVTRSHALRWSFNNNKLEPINFSPSNRPSRQSWEGELCENGMFYMTRASVILETGLLQWGNCGVVVIDQWDSLDIDTPLDLLQAQLLHLIRKNCPGMSFIAQSEEMTKLISGLRFLKLLIPICMIVSFFYICFSCTTQLIYPINQ